MQYARDVARFAVAQGAAGPALLAAAGLSAELLGDLDGWVDRDRMAALWTAAVDQTGDPDFGLHIGQRARPGAAGIVGYLMLSANTLGHAFEALAHYSPLVAMGGAIHLDRRARRAALKITPFSVPPETEAARQLFEAALAALASIAGVLTGRALPIRAVAFALARPPTGTATHEAVFGVVPTFGAPSQRIGFDAAALRWPGRSASPALFASFTREADLDLSRMGPDIRGRVAAAIGARLRAPVPPLAEVAADLAMGARTLQRQLEDAGTTFRRVCDDVRQDAAVRYLSRGDETVQQIALRLGYSEASAFHRAFKRWTGQTPAAFRAAAALRGRLPA